MGVSHKEDLQTDRGMILFRSVFFSGFGSTKPMLAVLCDTYLLFTKNSGIMIQTNRDLSSFARNGEWRVENGEFRLLAALVNYNLGVGKAHPKFSILNSQFNKF